TSRPAPIRRRPPLSSPRRRSSAPAAAPAGSAADPVRLRPEDCELEHGGGGVDVVGGVDRLHSEGVLAELELLRRLEGRDTRLARRLVELTLVARSPLRFS